MTRIAVDQNKDMLGVIDVQPTFMEGGELPVPDGAAVVPVINRLLHHRFRNAFATQDWHPPHHSSFASRHPGREPYEQLAMPYGPQILWPDHAIQNTPGAALHPALDQHRIEIIIRKGWRPEIDSYSAFLENDGRTSTGLKGILRDRSIERLFLAGLAADFCVAWSARHAVEFGFQVFVILDGVRGIGLPTPDGADTIIEAHAELHRLGVRFIRSDDLDGY
ncbi:bifunctional nicotinamidase/pyrazinamidase [Rhizosaccharibacter radicis]|uniref:nicotinamidase n=1 Tax=Rhizosaccharibacter radicis TaxID=2782605 RepID=A0ABT1W3A6_9PROT|nr:bifunctional nicotinamidase/pyrazinamidase [Acetobacteraceae bacterium KSS12]